MTFVPVPPLYLGKDDVAKVAMHLLCALTISFLILIWLDRIIKNVPRASLSDLIFVIRGGGRKQCVASTGLSLTTHCLHPLIFSDYSEGALSRAPEHVIIRHTNYPRHSDATFHTAHKSMQYIQCAFRYDILSVHVDTVHTLF